MEQGARREATAVVDSGYADRVATFLLRETFGGRRLAVLVFGCLLMATGALLLGEPEWTAGIVLGLGVGALLLRRTVRRRFERLVPVGFRYRARCDPEGLWIAGPPGESTTFYAALAGVKVRGDVALVQMRGTDLRRFVPAELFAGPLLTELEASIAAARPTH